MERLKILFFSLSDRDRKSLIALIYAIVIIGGFLILLPSIYDFSKRKQTILKSKTVEFYTFKELLSRYKGGAKTETVNLTVISNIAERAGFNDFIISLKPLTDGFEIQFENADGKTFSSFLEDLKKNGITVLSVRLNMITGKLKGSLILSGERI